MNDESNGSDALADISDGYTDTDQSDYREIPTLLLQMKVIL